MIAHQHNFLRSEILIFAVLLVFSCANIRNISGGPEDRTPPVVDIKKSTPNHQTNFRPQEIRLSFNEWINLNNPQQNIIFSPAEKKSTLQTTGQSSHYRTG